MMDDVNTALVQDDYRTTGKNTGDNNQVVRSLSLESRIELDEGSMQPCNSEESCDKSHSPVAPATTPSPEQGFSENVKAGSCSDTAVFWRDFLSRLENAELNKRRGATRRGFDGVREIEKKYFKNRKVVSPDKQVPLIPSPPRNRPHHLQPLNKTRAQQTTNHRSRHNRKKRHNQGLDVSGNALITPTKWKPLPNKDYVPGSVKTIFHQCYRCVNRMSAHDHHSWIEAFHLACRARRGGRLKSIADGEPLLSVKGSRDYYHNNPRVEENKRAIQKKAEDRKCQNSKPIEENKLPVLKAITEGKGEEDKELVVALPSNNHEQQHDDIPPVRRPNIKQRRRRQFAKQLKCETIEHQLEGVMITMPIELEHIQSCNDCQRVWTPKLTPVKMPSIIRIEGEHFGNKTERDARANELESPSSYKMITQGEDSSSLTTPEAEILRQFSYSVMEDNTTVYRPDSIMSMNGASGAQPPVRISSDNDLVPHSLIRSSSDNELTPQADLNRNASAIETKLQSEQTASSSCFRGSQNHELHDSHNLNATREVTVVDKSCVCQGCVDSFQGDPAVLRRLGVNKMRELPVDHLRSEQDLEGFFEHRDDVSPEEVEDDLDEQEEEGEQDMEEEDEEENGDIFYELKRNPPKFRENFALPTGKMLCYTAMTDKRYNKWRRRKRKAKKKIKKKSAGEKTEASTSSESTATPPESLPKSIEATMKYRHDFLREPLKTSPIKLHRTEIKTETLHGKPVFARDFSDLVHDKTGHVIKKKPITSQTRPSSFSPYAVLVSNFDASTAGLQSRSQIWELREEGIPADREEENNEDENDTEEDVDDQLVEGEISGEPEDVEKDDERDIGESVDDEFDEAERYEEHGALDTEPEGDNVDEEILRLFSASSSEGMENHQTSNKPSSTESVDCVSDKESNKWKITGNVSKDGADAGLPERPCDLVTSIEPAEGAATSHVYIKRMQKQLRWIRRDLLNRNSIVCPLSATLPKMNMSVSGKPSKPTRLCVVPNKAPGLIPRNYTAIRMREAIPTSGSDNKWRRYSSSKKSRSKHSKRRSPIHEDIEAITIQDLLTNLNIEDKVLTTKQKNTTKKFGGPSFREIYGKSPYASNQGLRTVKEKSTEGGRRSISALSITHSFTFSVLPLPNVYKNK